MRGKQTTPKDSTECHQVVEINDDDWIKAKTVELNKCRPRRRFPKRCTIFKVPDDIRKCDKEGAYDPVLVAIGPYHHRLCKDSTVPAMRDHKWDCVRRLLSRRTNSSYEATDLFRSCLLKMKEMDARVRKCYSEDLHYLNPHDLAMIMLLDGCFIIHLLLNFNEGKFNLTEMIDLNDEQNDIDEEEEIMAQVQEIAEEEEEEESTDEDQEIFEEEESMAEDQEIVEEKDESMAKDQEMVELDVEKRKKLIDGRLKGMERISIILLYDLLKLENQIPFFIVRKLFDKLKTSKDEEINLEDIAWDLLQDARPSEHGRKLPATSPAAYDREEDSHSVITSAGHFWAALGVLSGATRAAMSALSGAARWVLKLATALAIKRSVSEAGEAEDAGNPKIHHLLHLFHKKLEPSKECVQPKTEDVEWIPTAVELERAGIKFKENKKAKSFLDIWFKNNSGTIEIPQLNLDDFTNTLFKNLIAFEQCFSDASKHIISYTLFMDYIINTSEDARLLALKEILVNLLGTDDAAASLFNRLCEKIIHNPKQLYLGGLHMEVKKYYNSWCHKQRAQLTREYCSSPWALISFLAALLLLFLTLEESFISNYTFFRSFVDGNNYMHDIARCVEGKGVLAEV